MVSMRGLVIVHERDLDEISSLVSGDGRLTGEIWNIKNCAFEFCKFYIKSDRTGALANANNDPVSAVEVAQRYSVVILIAARHAADDPHLLQILADFLHGKNSPPWANEAVVVLSVAPTAGTGLHRLPSQRVFFAPSDSLVDPPPFTSGDWQRKVRSDLDGLSRMIDENQTRNPNVGFGLLLVDRQCRCLLMERLRDPGREKLGTIGGNFERGHSIVEELATVLERRFRKDSIPEVDLGPLLSCTNMKNDFLHYIDLTFLAIVKGGSRVNDVLDPELQPLGREALELLSNDRSRSRSSISSETRRMFTLPEVAVFYQADRLFAPVANAFEALCRTIFMEQLRHGPRRRMLFPSLIDEGRMLELQLPEDRGCIRDIVTDMPSSRSALPFFEGDIS
jgi:hypothetical protein